MINVGCISLFVASAVINIQVDLFQTVQSCSEGWTDAKALIHAYIVVSLVVLGVTCHFLILNKIL
jgi:hypothetical protein